MGHADTAERPGGRQIGVDRIGFQAAIGNVIGTARDIATGLGIDRAIKGIGADFIKRFDLAGQNAAIALETGFDLDQGAVTSAGEKDFITGQHPLHRTARFARQSASAGSSRAWVLPP